VVTKWEDLMVKIFPRTLASQRHRDRIMAASQLSFAAVARRTFWDLDLQLCDERRTVSEPGEVLHERWLEVAKDDESICTMAPSYDSTDVSSRTSEPSSLSDQEWQAEALVSCVPSCMHSEGLRHASVLASAKCSAAARGGRQVARTTGAESRRAQDPVRPAASAAEAEEHAKPDLRPTSLVITNIAKSASRAALLELLRAAGLDGLFDFLYLPIGFRNGLVVGHAFLNCTSHAAALAAQQALHGKVPSVGHVGDKPLAVNWSDKLQGREAFVERYRNSPMLQSDVPEEWQPLLFSGGRQVVFPAPTQDASAPAVQGVRD